eukprot:364462-Chlamydomonas_euryale.AAC.13
MASVAAWSAAAWLFGRRVGCPLPPAPLPHTRRASPRTCGRLANAMAARDRTHPKIISVGTRNSCTPPSEFFVGRAWGAGAGQAGSRQQWPPVRPMHASSCIPPRSVTCVSVPQSEALLSAPTALPADACACLRAFFARAGWASI